MKKIEAIVRLNCFDAIRDALADVGVNFFTLKDVKGFGLQKGKQVMYRGSVYDSSFIARLQLDILTTDEKVEEVVEAILHTGKTGEVGDGKITVLNVESVTRIRTAEIGRSAI